MKARPVAHIDESHLIAFAHHQGSEIAMHVIEIGQGQVSVAAKGFQSATHVDRAVIEHPAAEPVGEARRDSLGEIVASLYPDSRNHCGAGGLRFGMEGREHFGDVGRVVLAVAVECHHDAGARSADTGPERPALAAIAAMPDHAQHRHLGFQFQQASQSLVAGAIIHKNDFNRIVLPHRGDDLPRQWNDVLGLVLDRHDDRKVNWHARGSVRSGHRIE